jgi:hypothetical protein
MTLKAGYGSMKEELIKAAILLKRGLFGLNTLNFIMMSTLL